MQKRRYPGVSPFSGEQQNIFFGRTEDIKKLHKLILLRNQVLLYSKSGIGKTSLLNAGVLPLLYDKYETINIRFTAFNEKSILSPIDNIIRTLNLFIKDKNLYELINKDIPEIDNFFAEKTLQKTLWYYFKKIQISECFEKKFILVFDQFEELFSYPEEMQNQFKEQLAELTRMLIPNNLIEQINTQIQNIDKQDDLIDRFSEKIEIKTVFAIRSDRLSLLNTLSDKIPDIQEVFYELKPLSYQQVEEAIVKPASEKGTDFETPAFEYLPQTINKIIDELSEYRKQSIETTQLQIVCQQIEDIAKQKSGKAAVETHGNKFIQIIIELNDLPKFDAIFYNFYEQAVKKLDENKQTKARLLIEDQLIRNNQRISLDENICTDYIGKDELNVLVSTHLLRAERNSLEGISYELSHDTLLTPIIDARKLRVEKEEEEKAEAERQEELRIANEKAEKIKIESEKKRKQQRTIITIVSIAAVVSIVLAIFALLQMQKAKELTYKIGFKDAIAYFDKEEYDEALKKFVYMRDSVGGQDDKTIQKYIIECQTMDSLKTLFYYNLAKADTLLKQDLDSLPRVLTIYNQINELNYLPGSNILKLRFQNLENRKADIVQKWKDQAAIFAQASYKDKAIEILMNAKKIAPNDKEIDKMLMNLK